MNILIIGLGSIAHKHIAALKALNHTATIWALRHSANAKIEDGIINIYNVNEINFTIHFVLIANPTINHLATIQYWISKNIPLFIEKPLFDTLLSDETLMKNNTTPTYIACNLRFHPCIVFLKNYLTQHNLKINEVNAYCGSYLPNWRPGINFRENYSANKAMGGGVHLDLIHEIDYLYYLFGKPQHIQKRLKSASTLQIDAIDYAQYNLEYASFCCAITLNYYRPDSKRTLEIVCDTATYTVDLLKNTIVKNDEIIAEYTIDNLYTYKAQMNYFLANYTNTTPMMNNINEAYEVLKIALAQ